MIFKNFTIQVMLHLTILISITGLSTWFFMTGSLEMSLLGLLLIIIDSCILVNSFNRTTRSIAYFFESVENEDSQLRLYSKTKNKAIQRLYNGINHVNHLIAETKQINKRNEQYYKALIQQSATGLIVMNDDKSIELANDKACELTGILVPVNFKRLELKNPELWTLLCNIKPGDTETYKILQHGIFLHLLIRATGMRFNENGIKLISMQDIKHELDAKETEAWQKLIRILTHEIMNSIAPITSLTSTLTKLLKKNGMPVSINNINEDMIKDTLQGLDIISERGNALLDFVTNYRRLTKIPNPVFNQFSTEAWLHNIKILLFEKLEENHILMDIHVHNQSNTLYGDEKLLTQVLLNLIYNAMDALKDSENNKSIKISVTHKEHNKTQITVCNNGPMIDPDIQDKIFFPFFTTKENGSGIGLSLSKQVIQSHHGYLYMESDDNLTKFIIVL